MTTDEKIGMLKAMQGNNTSPYTSDILVAYIKLAESVVLQRLYPFNADIEEVPSKYENNVIEIANYMLNKQGAEGETSHNENGISRNYESGGIPYSMLKDIVPFAKKV